MQVALTPILNKAQAGYSWITSMMSQWKGYRVTYLDKVTPYLQNHWIASATLIGMNILFFEVVVSICRLVHRLLNQNYRYELLSASERNTRALELGTLFVITMGGLNWVFCKALRLSLPVWKVAAISIPTVMIYLFVKTI